MLREVDWLATLRAYASLSASERVAWVASHVKEACSEQPFTSDGASG